MTDYTLIPLNNGNQQMSSPLGSGEPPVDPPTEPTDYLASFTAYPSSTSVRLVWALKPGVANPKGGFKLVRVSPAGEILLPGTERGYFDQGLTAETPYTYRLIPLLENGTEGVSLQVSTTTTVAPPSDGSVYAKFGSINDHHESGNVANRIHFWSNAGLGRPYKLTTGKIKPLPLYWCDGAMAENYTTKQFEWSSFSHEPTRNNGQWNYGRGNTSQGSIRVVVPIGMIDTTKPLYVTIRFKDLILISDYPSRIPSINFGGNKQEIPVVGDGSWKTITYFVPANAINKEDKDYLGHWLITIGNTYSENMTGMFILDRMKISETDDISEFPPDEPGLTYADFVPDTSSIAPSLAKHEYIPGEGTMFPYGGYKGMHGGMGMVLGDDHTATTLSTNPNDQINIYLNSYFNTVCLHIGDQDWFKDAMQWPETDQRSSFRNIAKKTATLKPGFKLIEQDFVQTLRKFADAGLYAVPNPLVQNTRGSIVNTAYTAIVHKQEDPEQGFSQHYTDSWEEILRAYGDNPGLLAWKTVDEANHNGSGDSKPCLWMRMVDKLQKDVSPNRGNMVTIMGSTDNHPAIDNNAEVFGECFDIIAQDVYYSDATYRIGTKTGCLLAGLNHTMAINKSIHERFGGQTNPTKIIWAVPGSIQSTMKEVLGHGNGTEALLTTAQMTNVPWTHYLAMTDLGAKDGVVLPPKDGEVIPGVYREHYWFSKVDANGVNRAADLALISPGDSIHLNADPAVMPNIEWEFTVDGVQDMGTYYEIRVTQTNWTPADTQGVIGGYTRAMDMSECVAQAIANVCFGAKGILWYRAYYPDRHEASKYFEDLVDEHGNSYSGTNPKYGLWNSWAGMQEAGRMLVGPEGIGKYVLYPHTTTELAHYKSLVNTGFIPTLTTDPDTTDWPIQFTKIFNNKNSRFYHGEAIIHSLYTLSNGALLLITVNGWELPLTQEIELDPSLSIPDGTITVLQEGRTVPISGHRFTDKWYRYQPHFYLLKGVLPQ